MKVIGLLGGMSWESTVVYYQHLNRLAREQLGGLHSARVLMWSFDFAEIEKCQALGDWKMATELMKEASENLVKGGAECIVICTNTMHKMIDEIRSTIKIPVIHIADATADSIKQEGSKKPLLLATRYTMEEEFYKGHLRDHHNIHVEIPNQEDRNIVHTVIYDELCQGIVNIDSKNQYLDIINREIENGIDSVILGCTEITLLVSQDDLNIPVFDTTHLHALAALKFSFNQN